jgi:16S rRNA processing protein RimM
VSDGPAATRAFADLVAVGRIVKPQGRKGEVVVEPLSDRSGRLPGLRRAWVPGPGGMARGVTITSCWPHKGRFVLKLEGVDSIDQAEGYRGLELGIGEEELEALPAGSYYHHQLLGLAVQDESGEMLGTVQGVLETGAEARVLEVRGPRGELLVPMAETFIRTVDLANRRVTVTLRELVEC